MNKHTLKISMSFVIVFKFIISVYPLQIRTAAGFTSSIDNAVSIPVGTPFGMNHVGSEDQAVFANQAGIQIDRFDFYWEGVQYINSSVFDYTGLLEFVQNLTANHIAPLGILDYGNKYLLGSGDDQYIPPDNISIWLNYVNETVDLFQNYGVYWEIWNEPNLSWTGPMNDFFYLLNRTACFIHEYYPDQKVISPGISGSWPSYLTAMIQYIGATNFEAWFYGMAFHPYCTNAEEITPAIQGVQQVANQFHFTGQLWITEFGYGTSGTPTDLLYQADQIVKYYSQALSLNVSHICWYAWGGGAPGGGDWGFGIIQTNMTTYQNYLRPAGIAYQYLSNSLTNGSYDPSALSIQINPTIDHRFLWVYPFLTNCGSLLLTMWTTTNNIAFTLNFGKVSLQNSPFPIISQQDYYTDAENLSD